MARLKTGVLISGRGSNLQALIEACRDPAFPAEITAVISNKADAAGLAIAQAAGIATLVIEPGAFPDRPSFDAEIDLRLTAAGVELVCLAGYMRLLSAGFVARWRDRMINIHPSLLPAFPGLKAQAQALEAGVKMTGCTVHFVRPDMDSGPLIIQAMVAVRAGDTAESLAARILAAEHRIYPMALRLLGEGRVRIEGERAIIDGAADAGPLLVGPTP